MKWMTSLIFLLVVAGLFQPWMFGQHEHLDFSGFVPQLFSTSSDNASPRLHSRFITPQNFTRESHSATLVPLSMGKVRAVWYGGSEEGAKDVNLYTATFDEQVGSWSRPSILFTRNELQRLQRRYIRKLGNPVLGRAPDGRLHLFFVSAGIGGWGTSAINHAISEDEGETWSQPRRIRTSALLNLGTLVKGKPIWDKAGNLWLPGYNELFGKHPELLVFSAASGKLIKKAKLPCPDEALQPELVPVSDSHAFVLTRYAGEAPNRMLVQTTESAGESWSAAEKTRLANPDSAISAVAYREGILVAFNDHEEERNNLSLAYFNHAKGWQPLLVLEGDKTLPEDHENEFSYPSLVQEASGDFHLAYTWNKNRIKHVQFNSAWLDAQLEGKEVL